jgi:hypothetical protein
MLLLLLPVGGRNSAEMQQQMAVSPWLVLLLFLSVSVSVPFLLPSASDEN